MQKRSITDHLLMVRPAAFGYNEQTAENNTFQERIKDLTAEEIQQRARNEFDAFVRKLRNHDISVTVFEDTLVPRTPDAIFPNNWITTHEDGTIITYPMYSHYRRRERREDIIAALKDQFEVNRHLRYELHEVGNQYLEGTGSMIFDRANQMVYACRSDRTSDQLLGQFASDMGATLCLFDAIDSSGTPIYHTNVMMALGEEIVILCTESIVDGPSKNELLSSLERTGHQMVDIDFEQVKHFAGNMIQVENRKQVKYMIMSEAAYLSLNSNQIAAINEDNFILHAAIPTIEKVGGGSVRCMIAEIFLIERARKH